jgi:hypothetical protein
MILPKISTKSKFLKVTVPSASSTSDCSPLSAQEVWPQENEIDLSLALLTQLKIMAMSVDLSTLPLDGIYYKMKMS